MKSLYDSTGRSSCRREVRSDSEGASGAWRTITADRWLTLHLPVQNYISLWNLATVSKGLHSESGHQIGVFPTAYPITVLSCPFLSHTAVRYLNLHLSHLADRCLTYHFSHPADWLDRCLSYRPWPVFIDRVQLLLQSLLTNVNFVFITFRLGLNENLIEYL